MGFKHTIQFVGSQANGATLAEFRKEEASQDSSGNNWLALRPIVMVVFLYERPPLFAAGEATHLIMRANM